MPPPRSAGAPGSGWRLGWHEDRRNTLAMAPRPSGQRWLGQLHPLERNRYYYGKLMDVLHSTREQDYGLAKSQLFNRTVLGAGVVCGLQLSGTSVKRGLH